MRKYLLILFILFSVKTQATVLYGSWGITKTKYGCSDAEFFLTIGFSTYSEINNDHFEIQRSPVSNFGGYSVVAQINGCGTCSGRGYSIIDYGPFITGTTYYYQIVSTSNFGFEGIPYPSSPMSFSVTVPSVVNWINQVTSTVTIGSSPNTESSYSWSQETRGMQGVSINLIPSEINNIYLEENNNKINFDLNPSFTLVNLDVNIDNQGYFNLYSGSATTSFIWQNSSSSFLSVGSHSLKVKYIVPSGTIYFREYEVYVVSKSDGFYRDNYCNTMRVWKGSDPVGGRPLILSEGFDAYNIKSEQYYREAGKDLINCLLNKGFDIYVVNYNLNSQSIKNNAAIFQSAIRYISSINNNKLVIAAGMSMGGVINRYACAKAENDGIPLPLYKFVTLDAPHQGAYISEALQVFVKTTNSENNDTYSDIASNNDAAKELLKKHKFDPSSNIHNSFFNYLNGLNGDGYPHLVEKIGVSFSTNQPSGYSIGEEWLKVKIHTPIKPDEPFYLEQVEIEPGSYLPKLNKDPFIAGPGKFWLLNATFIAYPFLYPRVDFYQYRYPSFIPHNSSLDIINGVSKFDVVIEPSLTSFHDEVPLEIVEPLVNALIEKNVYIQNINYSGTKTIIASKKIFAGKNVTNLESFGDVNILSNAIVQFKAGEEIQLQDGFYVAQGAEFTGIIENVKCDGNIEFQHKNIQTSSPNASSTQQNNFDSSYEIVYEDSLYNETQVISINSEIQIFPNPTNGIINIVTAQQMDLRYIISNMQGVELEEGDIENSNQIDIRSLTSGIYILKIMNDKTNEIEQFKVIRL